MKKLALLLLCLCSAFACSGFISLKPYAVDGDDMLALVNKEYRLEEPYTPDGLSHVSIPFIKGVPYDRKRLKRETARALENLVEAAREDGFRILGVSGYRSFAVQGEIYEARLSETSLEYVSRYIAKAGESEHQLGLAIDVTTDGAEALTEAFARTEEYEWLTMYAAKFGFIIRYLEDGEPETGYAFEPWHIRYVGDRAQTIADSGLTLEAYLSRNHPVLVFATALPRKAWAEQLSG
jgi:D-alanyl-D-alanine carboxypeptidase